MTSSYRFYVPLFHYDLFSRPITAARFTHNSVKLLISRHPNMMSRPRPAFPKLGKPLQPSSLCTHRTYITPALTNHFRLQNPSNLIIVRLKPCDDCIKPWSFSCVAGLAPHQSQTRDLLLVKCVRVVVCMHVCLIYCFRLGTHDVLNMRTNNYITGGGDGDGI